METLELSKERKIEVLKLAIELLKKHKYTFMCTSIGGRLNLNCGSENVKDYIPEFNFNHFIEIARKHKYKKPEPQSAWWGDSEIDRKRRITFLNILIREIEYVPKMVAKLVVTTFVTRVVVPENATFDQIMSAALPRLSEKLVTEMSENVDDIIDDLECPYVDPVKAEIEDQIDTLEKVKEMVVRRSVCLECFVCNAINIVLFNKGIVSENYITNFNPSKYISLCTRENASIACSLANVTQPWENGNAWWLYTNVGSRVVFIDWMINELKKQL